MSSNTRVRVANRADGGVFYWLGKLYGFAVIIGLTAMLVVCLMTYSYFRMRTPPPQDLRAYAKVMPRVTRMYAADGTMLGEFAKEWRELDAVRADPEAARRRVPRGRGSRLLGPRRDLLQGHRARAVGERDGGDFAQGGSTITQQVAKQFLGAREVAVAQGARKRSSRGDLEALYSKKAILAVYLNQIYLGAGACGVAAAARRYFDKDLDQLTLAECALIAGLAKAPTGVLAGAPQASSRSSAATSCSTRWPTYGVATADEVSAAKA